MGRSEWAFDASGVVDASHDAVMAWWFHPDRADDFLIFATNAGAIDTSYTETIDDGVRVRIYEWCDRRGWRQRHRAEAHLPDGMVEIRDDRFVAPAREVVVYKSPRGDEMTKSCVGRTEFIPLAQGGTEVRSFHRHSLDGGRWFWRVKIENADRSNTVAIFNDYIDRCQKMVGLCDT